MSPHRFVKGTLLANRYEVLNYHAAGGMQEVYRCFDHALRREVVVKTPKAGVQDRRFRRGAEMGARVNHSNIAATFDYFENDEMTFLVEEFIPGVDLGQRLNNEFYFFDPSLAAHVLHHIAKALLEAHRSGICHRDLKPSNVMTSSDPGLTVVKLTDFGIAKLAENEIAAEMELFGKDESTLTSSNTLLGAVPYMAPECWDDWKGAGQPMDVWAFGCVAYHLLAGDPPFGVGRVAIMNVAKLMHSPPNLVKPAWFGSHKTTENLENGLWEIIVSCIQVDPKNRPTANDLALAFNALCYANAPRRLGAIQRFKVPYQGGGTGQFGFIDDSSSGDSWFFHRTDFYGGVGPSNGQKVSYCIYPGIPNSRSSPVLLLK